MSTGIVTRRKSAMHIDNSYGIDVVAANTNLVSKRVLKGEPFSTQIVCDEGYSIYEITIKMGGVDITSTAYDATYNMISIASVTDDVDIECYAMHTMPSDYIRVDGIKNPSNAYLGTEYKVTPQSRLELSFVLVWPQPTVYDYIGTSGHTNDIQISGWRIFMNTNQYYKGNVYAHTGGDSGSHVIYTGLNANSNTIGKTHVLISDYYKQEYYADGNKVTSIKTKSATDQDYFCLYSSRLGYYADRSAGQIVHHFKIYDYSTNSYVRYYIPCLNDSGVAGFWDAARGVFQGSSNSTAFQPVYVQDNLIAHYDGIDNAGIGVHDASATIWKDLKGSNDATASIETVTWESDCWNSNSSYAYFDAGTTIGNALNMHDFTLEFVAMPQNMTSQSGSITYATTRTSSSVTKYFAILGKFNFLYMNNGNDVRIESPAIITNDTKYHLVARRKGNVYSIFINGVRTSHGTLKNPNTGSDNPYRIGASYNSASVAKIYAHRVYTKALTDDEIIENYNIDKLRFNF